MPSEHDDRYKRFRDGNRRARVWFNKKNKNNWKKKSYLVADVREKQRLEESEERQTALDDPQLERSFYPLDRVPIDYRPRLERLVRQISAPQEFGFVAHYASVAVAEKKGWKTRWDDRTIGLTGVSGVGEVCDGGGCVRSWTRGGHTWYGQCK